MLDWEFVICESGTNGNRIVAFYICVGDEFLGVRFGIWWALDPTFSWH